MEERSQTWGEAMVGLDFNPSGDEAVIEIKKAAANFIDVIHKYSTNAHYASTVTELSIRAQEEVLIAQMLAVKFVTWNKEK